MTDDPLKRLVLCLSRLPGIGEKTATRMAFHLIRGPSKNLEELAAALTGAANGIHLCSLCHNLTQCDPCNICEDPTILWHQICVVAKPSDVTAIAAAGSYRGTFHVLHGLLNPLNGIGPDDIHLTDLAKRLERKLLQANPRELEVIIATDSSVEGDATAAFIALSLKPLDITVTRIATGIPVGAELEYTDQATIARAITNRTKL